MFRKKYFEDNTEADFTKNKQLKNNILLLNFICFSLWLQKASSKQYIC